MNQALFQPIEFEPNVGPRRAALMAKLPVRTPAEMLFFFPRAYDDFSHFTDIHHLEKDVLQTVCVRVAEVSCRPTYHGNITTIAIEDGTYGLADIVYFNQGFRAEQFRIGQIYLVSGKPKSVKKRWQFSHPVVRLIPEEELALINESAQVGNQLVKDAQLDKIPTAAAFLGLQPIYPLTEGLQGWELRRIAKSVLAKYADTLDEAFPTAFRERCNLAGVAEAVRKIHFPANPEEMEFARRRFVFQELFLLQLALEVRRRQQQIDYRAPVLEVTPDVDRRIRQLFPYDLTAGQLRAIADITKDMISGRPMNRLLQGDVGCGKTTVAVYAILLAVAHGFQATIMAPTEVLAHQHFRTLSKLLQHSPVQPLELVGGLRPAERQKTLQKIASGDAKLVVGTQALLQKDVAFDRLGVVVIDEQHKFGVQQRAALRKSGESPHYLVMTATPIPRTVTMTLFGDLDVTSIRELPPGRQKIHTYLASNEKRAGWWTFFKGELAKGAQGYVVVPRIGQDSGENDQPMLDLNLDTDDTSESETVVADLMRTYRDLSTGPLQGIPLDILNGRMSTEEKEAVMFRFRTGETKVLISTSVIEVGVDIPNATLMTIDSAERFGLAQLHQLRGRISRGPRPGYCCVFASNTREDTLERLKVFTSTSDGFELAEVDFRYRGPGNLFGTQQHGLPPFRVADLLRDQEILEETRAVAREILQNDPGLSHSDFRRLREQMLSRYGKVLELGDVG